MKRNAGYINGRDDKYVNPFKGIIDQHDHYLLVKSGKISTEQAFSSFIFNTGGQTGRLGGSLANFLANYDTVTYPWLNDTSRYNVTTAGIQQWYVPDTGTYRITAEGASGEGPGATQAQGALIRGDFSLTAGDELRIVVGQVGTSVQSNDASGGGGSFVVKSPFNTNASILVIAGGAGGRNDDTGYGTWSASNAQGQSGNNGGASYNGGTAGTGGYGGDNGNQTTQGGAGFFGNSIDSTTGSSKIPAQSFTNNSVGGYANWTGSNAGYGGFGGGGASGRGANFGPAGGGGGYSGGAAGYNSQYGGGGGSYNNGTNQVNTAGGSSSNSRSGAGQVTIEIL